MFECDILIWYKNMDDINFYGLIGFFDIAGKFLPSVHHVCFSPFVHPCSVKNENYKLIKDVAFLHIVSNHIFANKCKVWNATAQTFHRNSQKCGQNELWVKCEIDS